MRKELQVSAIENGTVIDHIPSKNVFQVVRILGLEEGNEQVLFGTNLESKKYGRKGIIKLANRFFESDDINKIALAAPTATLIVIRNYQVIEKKRVHFAVASSLSSTFTASSLSASWASSGFASKTNLPC